MSYSITKKKFIFWITLSTLIIAVVGGVFLKTFLPTHYFSWYPIIPIFFYMIGMYGIYMFDYCRKKCPRKLLSVYMGMKFLKMILSIIFLLIYVLNVNGHREDFIVVFFLFYIFSTVFQTLFFYMYEHNKKKQILNKNK